MLILPLLLAGLQTTTAKKVAVSVVASVCTGVCVWCVWCELGVNKHIWEVPRGMCVQVSVCVCARARAQRHGPTQRSLQAPSLQKRSDPILATL